jgi:hypothetical protein
MALGLPLAACSDSGPLEDGASTVGTLVVSTASGGNDPDQDGYLLTVDGVDSLPLGRAGSSQIDLSPGGHTLRLLGMAEHCSVSPGTPLDVIVPSRDTTSVAFEVTCSVTGVRVRTTMTGLDFDPDGYRVEVDGAELGILPSSGTVLTQLDPGSHTIALTGLSPNCTIVGPGSHTVTIMDAEIAPISFAAACTATSGVIGVVVEAPGTDVKGSFRGLLDRARSFLVGTIKPVYLTSVPAGDHLVSLVAPLNCSFEIDRQSVTVTAGGLIRDTVEVAFSVTCLPHGPVTLRVTAHTTGSLPTAPFSVWICRMSCMEYGSSFVGLLQPNGTLVSGPAPGRYGLFLQDVPKTCSVQSEPPTWSFTIPPGAIFKIEYRIQC